MVRLYQSATSVLGPGWQTRWMSGQQQIVGRGRSRAGLGPEGLQRGENAGTLGGRPKSARQAEIQRGGREGDGSGAVLDQGGNAFSGAEIGLMDDARLAVDAGAFDDVVVELVAFLLGDEGSHIG